MTIGSLERRRARRRRHNEHGIIAARVRPGIDVALIDVSADGALIETSRRLLPGTAVELQLETRQARAAVRGRVVRCSVSRLRASSVSYRGAVSFDRTLPWLADEEPAGYGIPVGERGERRPGLPPRADATRHVL